MDEKIPKTEDQNPGNDQVVEPVKVHPAFSAAAENDKPWHLRQGPFPPGMRKHFGHA